MDLYVGGQEHAVLHLLYARFWHKVLHDMGVVDHPEPFLKLVHQGMILGSDGEKMSKSRGNVVNPDDIVQEHGADALRVRSTRFRSCFPPTIFDHGSVLKVIHMYF